ncbi:MAG: hypothetical protein D3909_00795 [Candidatus Electrothrix sp. ATG1]|nr:hypothetical protein [Candidatus Electrothrix sp. ATG1]
MFHEIVKRIQEVTGKEMQKELCEELGTTPKSFRAREKKEEFDINWAFRIGQRYKLSTDWIMTGEGPRSHKETIKEAAAVTFGKWMEEQRDKDPRLIPGIEIKLEEAFPDYKEWLDAKNTKAKAA